MGAEPGRGSRYRLLIFDLDGTLIDSAPDLCTALGRALGERGLPEPDVATTRRLVGEGQRVLIERALAWAGLDPDTPGLVEQVLPRFRLHYSEHLCERTTVYPGVEAALGALPRPQAVATNKPGAWARRLVESLRLGGSLSWVLGEDYSTETAMIFGEVYRHGGEWKFKAVGQGYSGGLYAMCQQFGVNIG